MKIAAYVAGYAPDAGGGYTFENDVLNGLLARLRSGDPHDFCIMCPASSEPSLRAHIAPFEIEVLPIPEGRLRSMGTALLRDSDFLRSHWRRPYALDRVADKGRVDFIWFLGAGVHLTNRPYATIVWDIQHLNTPWFPEMSGNGLWDGREMSHNWFLRRASVVVTGTRRGQHELNSLYHIPIERLPILPHPTPQFALDAGVPEKSRSIVDGLGLTRPYVLYPAQFWPHKNHVNLIESLARLKRDKGVAMDLALVGSDKGNRGFLEAVADRLGVRDAIHFLGFVDRSDLIALYQEAVALTYASWCGPENLPPLEAFALGCPVVATDIPGAQEQLGDAAILVDPANPSAIADGILKVHQDPRLREGLIEKGHVRARKWTPTEYVNGFLDHVEKFEPILKCWNASPQREG